MKKAKIAGLGLVGLLVVVLTLAYGISVRPVLDPVIGKIQNATGYRLRIVGPTKIAFRPFLAVIADDVHIADAGSAADEESLAAERVQIGLSVIGLITGDVRISDLTVRRPVWRVDVGHQGSSQSAQPSSGPPAEALGVGQITIMDGTLVFRGPSGTETLLDHIDLKASLRSPRGIAIDAAGSWGGQRVHASMATEGPVASSAGPVVGVTATVSSPDRPQWAMSATGKLRLDSRVVQLEGLKGTLGEDPFDGSASIDLSGPRPHVQADVSFARIRVARAVPAAQRERGRRATVGEPAADAPWSDAPVDLSPLNLFDADVKLSAGELMLGKVRLAPVSVDAKLVMGVAVASLSRTELYGGKAGGTLVFDASAPHPRCVSQIDLVAVSALALLEDAADFGHLDGHIYAKFDLKATGESIRGMLSTLGGRADIEFRDAIVRGVDLPKMVQLLTKGVLQGWHEDGNTRLDRLGADFRVVDGVATTDNLRASGPLLSVTGKGVVDLVGQTLEFTTDPNLILNVKGQGPSDEPIGLGVPVVVRGPWSNPRIYPDVANVLESPDNAYAKLAELGIGLFGLAKKQPGFSLESILEGVANTVGRSEPEATAPKPADLAQRDAGPSGAVEQPLPDVGVHPQIAEAKSDARVGLVIGNANYPDNGEALAQPLKDAHAIADELRKSGFEVIVGENLAKQATRAAIDNFKAKVKPGSVALIFFSGFGIQSERQSYMIPVDAQIWTQADVLRDGFSLEQILADLDSLGASIKIAIIDASRKNPFERRFRRYSAGLASIDAPTGTLVLSAAAPGRVGIEGGTGDSLFITQLIKELRTPGVSAEDVFNRTRVGVSRASNNTQVPWMSSSLSEIFYFVPGAAASASTAIVEPAHPVSPGNTDHPKPGKPKQQPPNAKNATAVANKPQDTANTTTDQLPSETNQTLKTLGDSIRLHPDDANAFYRRGLVYAQNHDYEHAAADFGEAIRRNPSDAEALNNRCWTRAILGQLQAALADCNEALRLRPAFTDAFDSRGLTQLKLGHYRQAISDFDAALQSNPKQVSSLYGRGKAKLKSGDSAGGNADIKSAKTMDPNIVDEFAKYGVE